MQINDFDFTGLARSWISAPENDMDILEKESLFRKTKQAVSLIHLMQAKGDLVSVVFACSQIAREFDKCPRNIEKKFAKWMGENSYQKGMSTHVKGAIKSFHSLFQCIFNIKRKCERVGIDHISSGFKFITSLTKAGWREIPSDIMDVFQNQVEEFGDWEVTGVVYENSKITYAELDSRSNRLAHYLRQKHQIGPNVPVAIMGSGKLEMLICQLAILKAGGAFVPFEPDIPVERLDTIKAAKAKLIIACDEKSRQVLSAQENVLDLRETQSEIDTMSDEKVVVPDSKPTDLAYILFTSGSTAALPKGVMQTRGGLLGQIRNYTKDIKITHNDTFLQLASMTHDQSIVDIYGALLNGAELHLVNKEELKNPQKLQRLIAERGITIFSSIPSMFSLIFHDAPGKQDFPKLRIVTLGGEAVKKEHVALYQEIAHPYCLFVNGYGATEFSWISYFVITQKESLEQLQQIPLGVITSWTEVFLDLEAGNNKDVGELCVHAEFMSPGYWQNEEATKKAFFMRGGKLFYRTGDLAMKGKDNVYHFKGRLSWHEKINGKRVNLLDIEDCMRQKFPVEECVVLAHGDENKKLYAFFAVKPGANFTPDRKVMRRELEKILLFHEIPSEFVHLEKFPLLPNGKINRQAIKTLTDLQAEQKRKKREAEIQHLAPVDQLFYEILDLDQPPSEEFNFFEYGISSLQLMHFVSRLNSILSAQEPKVQLEVADLLQVNTNQEVKDLLGSKKTSTYTRYYEMRKVRKNIAKVGSLLYLCKEKEKEALLFTFWAQKVLADYYNKKYGIKIIPCETHEQFTKTLKMHLAYGEGQIGLVWHKDNNPRLHPTACILHVDVADGRKGSLFITDSFGAFPLDMQRWLGGIPDLTLYLAPYTGRQFDTVSCSMDVICYLKDGLRMDMKNEIHLLTEEEIKSLTRFEISRMRGWGLHLVTENTGPLDNVVLFQNPVELLKHAQSLEFPEDLKKPIDPSHVLKLSKKRETLTQFRKRHEYLAEYTPENAVDATILGKTIRLESGSLYTKSKKFKQILDSCVQEEDRAHNGI